MRRTLKERFRAIESDIRIMANRKTIIQYDVMMGLICAAILSLIELISFFVVPAAEIEYRYFFLAASALMLVQMIGFWAIYQNDFTPKTGVQRFMLYGQPFFVIVIGLAITFAYQGHSNRIDSFLIAIFAASFIQIYPQKRRIILFLFSLILFNGMMLAFHGFAAPFLDGLRLSIMISILGYIYATITYQSHKNRIATMFMLEKAIAKQEKHMQRLKKVYDELESSHKITEAMMLTTSEILKNDRLDDVLQLVLDETIKLIPQGQAGSILILDGDKMSFRAATGYSLQHLQTITLSVDDLFQSKQADIFEPTIIRNLEVFDSSRLSDEKLEQFKARGALVAKSVLSCSFKFAGAFFGSINIDNFDSEDAYDEADKVMISHLAKQLEIIISIHKLYEKAIRPTKYDELTQAYSRRYQKELLGKAFEAAKESHEPLAICTIDINMFKEINDRYGHEIGDECLVYFADSVRANPFENMIFSRVGGDEFSFVFPHAGNAEVSRYVAELRHYLEVNLFVVGGSKEHVTFGCGVAVYPDDGKELAGLIRLSDARMYADKTAMKQN